MKKVFTLFAMLVMFASVAFADVIEVEATLASVQFYAEDNDLFINLQNDDYTFRFDIVCPTGATDIVDGQPYTLDDMIEDYTWGGIFATGEYITYDAVTLVRTNGTDYDVTITDVDGVQYHVVYEKPEPVTEPIDTVILNINDPATARVLDYTASDALFQVYGATTDGEYFVYFAVNATQIAGTYTDDDVNLQYSPIYHCTATDTTRILFRNLLPDATFTGNATALQGTINYVGLDSVLYMINFAYAEPTPTTTVNFNATDLNLAQDAQYAIYAAYYGVYVYDFMANTETEILAGYVMNEDDAPYGTFSVADEVVSFNVYDAETQMSDMELYSGSITIAKNGTATSLTGNGLFYGNVNYVFNCTGDATAVENVEASDYEVYNEGRVIVLNGAEGQNAAIYDIAGRMISNTMVNSDNARFEVAAAGVYVVRVNGESFRVVVK